jgi:enoyl-[acyl-carrier-protein] reductase (NADH)
MPGDVVTGAGRFTGKVPFATRGSSGIAAATSRCVAAEGGRVELALDAAVDGVRADAIAPRSVNTPLAHPVYGTPDVEQHHSMLSASIHARVSAPEEIAATACLLPSEEACFFRGAIPVTDGGDVAV